MNDQPTSQHINLFLTGCATHVINILYLKMRWKGKTQAGDDNGIFEERTREKESTSEEGQSQNAIKLHIPSRQTLNAVDCT